MWSKTNADKLKMELSGKREKQQQTVKNEKITKDNVSVKMDSGFLSGTNLSCNSMISKENIEYENKCEEIPKEKSKTIFDSGLDLGCESGCLSELDVDQKDIYKPCNLNTKNENYWKFYFLQNEDGDT